MVVGAKVLNRCYFIVVQLYYACFIKTKFFTHRPEKMIFYNKTLRSTNIVL